MEKVLGQKKWVLTLSMLLGLLICYAFGTLWFMVIYAENSGEIGLLTALIWCVFPFVIPDLAKMALALLFCSRINKFIKIN